MSMPVLRRDAGRTEALGVLLVHPGKRHKVQVVCAPYAAAPEYWLRVYDLMNILSFESWRPLVQRVVPSRHMTLRERWIMWIQRHVDDTLSKRALRLGFITFHDRRFDDLRAKTLKTLYTDVEAKEYVSTFRGSLLEFSIKSLLGLVFLRFAPASVIRGILTDTKRGTVSGAGLRPDSLNAARAQVLVDACAAESGNVYALVIPSCLQLVVDQLARRGYETDGHSTYYNLAYTE